MHEPSRSTLRTVVALLITLLVVAPAAAGRGDRDAGVIETSRIAPLYPLGAADAGFDATVLLAVLVGEDGIVRDVHVSESSAESLGFEEAAIAAIRQWRFRPARREGRRVESVSWHRLTFRSLNSVPGQWSRSQSTGIRTASISQFAGILGPSLDDGVSRSSASSRVTHAYAPPFPGRPGVLYDARSKPRYTARAAAASAQ